MRVWRPRARHPTPRSSPSTPPADHRGTWARRLRPSSLPASPSPGPAPHRRPRGRSSAGMCVAAWAVRRAGGSSPAASPSRHPLSALPPTSEPRGGTPTPGDSPPPSTESHAPAPLRGSPCGSPTPLGAGWECGGGVKGTWRECRAQGPHPGQAAPGSVGAGAGLEEGAGSALLSDCQSVHPSARQSVCPPARPSVHHPAAHLYPPAGLSGPGAASAVPRRILGPPLPLPRREEMNE